MTFKQPDFEPPTVRRAPPDQKVVTYSLTLSNGKVAGVTVPDDATDRDWLDLLAIIVTVVRPEHERRHQRNPLSQLELPGHNRS